VASGRATETSGQMQAGPVRSFSTQGKVQTESSHRPNGCTGMPKSSRTLNSGRTIFHYVRKDATLNSSKFLETDRHPDGIATSSGRKLLNNEPPDS
jgi:hypothetical protein